MTIKIATKNRVGYVTLNRPDKMNAFNTAMQLEFRTAVEQLDGDDDVSVLVVRGAGTGAFSAGGDLREPPPTDVMARRHAARLGAGRTVRACSKPVIASVRGYALGGGCELAVACDIRIASRDALFGFPEILHGWLPAGAGTTQLLPRLIGRSQAALMIMTGERVQAERAMALGLVDEVCDAKELHQRTETLAESIAKNDASCLVLAKSALDAAESSPVDVGMAYELELSSIRFLAGDRAAAVRRFADRSTSEGGQTLGEPDATEGNET